MHDTKLIDSRFESCHLNRLFVKEIESIVKRIIITNTHVYYIKTHLFLHLDFIN